MDSPVYYNIRIQSSLDSLCNVYLSLCVSLSPISNCTECTQWSISSPIAGLSRIILSIQFQWKEKSVESKIFTDDGPHMSNLSITTSIGIIWRSTVENSATHWCMHWRI